MVSIRIRGERTPRLVAAIHEGAGIVLDIFVGEGEHTLLTLGCHTGCLEWKSAALPLFCFAVTDRASFLTLQRTGAPFRTVTPLCVCTISFVVDRAPKSTFVFCTGIVGFTTVFKWKDTRIPVLRETFRLYLAYYGNQQDTCNNSGLNHPE